MAKKSQFYEGTTSAKTIIPDLARALCTGVVDDPLFDADGNLVKKQNLIIERNWDIVYPKANFNEFAVNNKDSLTASEYFDKISNQINHFEDSANSTPNLGHTMILKTKTTPKILEELVGTNNLGLENALDIDSIEMYVELYKPNSLVNLEVFHPETERFGRVPSVVTESDFIESISERGFKEVSMINDIIKPEQFDEYSDVVLDNGIALKALYSSSEDKKLISSRSLDSVLLLKKISEDQELQEHITISENIISDVTVISSTKNVEVTFLSSFTKYAEINTSAKEYFADVLKSIDNSNRPFNETTINPNDRFTFSLDFTIYGARAGTVSGKAYYKYDSFETLITDPLMQPSKSYYYTEIKKQRYQKQFKFTENFRIELEHPYTGENGEGAILPIDSDDYKKQELFIIGTSNDSNFNELFQFDLADPGVGVIKAGLKINQMTFPDSSLQYFNMLNTEDVTFSFYFQKDKALMPANSIVRNNHNIFIRMFDNLNAEGTGPAKNIVDSSNGEIITLNSHTSEWSKLSWYKDFEEKAVDELDDDPSITNITDGVVNLPITTPGLNGETRIRFWLNTSNDTVTLVLMGNPSLEFGAEKHLTSFGYLGQIESMENSINDTAGNFALITSSSTVPCKSETLEVIKRIPNNINITANYVEPTQENTEVFFEISLKDYNDLSDDMQLTVKKTDKGDSIDSLATTIKCDIDSSRYELEKIIVVKFVYGESDIIDTISNDIYLEFFIGQISIKSTPGAVRDIFGNIIELNFPTTQGVNTATGVTDISMLHTRSKAYFQKHELMFSATNVYMQKDQYGKSAYTSEYYADKAKIVHGNDGLRGTLKNILVIDPNSLISIDDLVINRDHERESDKAQETYVFFNITAPHSLLTSSPNSTYGLAVKKEEILPPPVNDAEAVLRAVEDLYVADTHMVFEDFFVPANGIEGTTITWESSNESNLVMTSYDTELFLAEITRPLAENGDIEVVMTATVSKGTESSVKTFTLNVKKQGETDAASVANDALSLELVSDTSSDLLLTTSGSNGTTMTWETSDENIITTSGVVTRPIVGTDPSVVTLTATITKGEVSETKMFTVNVLPWTNEELVEIDRQSLLVNGTNDGDVNLILGTNLLANEITSDLNLSPTLPNGSVITWTASEPGPTYLDIVTGAVTRPTHSQGDAPFVLTATLNKDGALSSTIVFSGITISKLTITNLEAVNDAVGNLTGGDDTIGLWGGNGTSSNLTMDFDYLSKYLIDGIDLAENTVSLMWDLIPYDTNDGNYSELTSDEKGDLTTISNNNWISIDIPANGNVQIVRDSTTYHNYGFKVRLVASGASGDPETRYITFDAKVPQL